MKNILLSITIVIVISLFLFAFKERPTEQSTAVARITYFPCNGGISRDYFAYSTPYFSNPYVKFKGKSGLDIYLMGSVEIIMLK